MKAIRVLLVEDSENDADLLLHQLKRLDFDVTLTRVETADALSAALDEHAWDIVISDYRMPHFSGLAALKIVRDHSRHLPFIIVSATIGEDIAVDSMRAGANDYVMKNNLPRLLPAIQRELQEARKRTESLAARKAQQEKLDYLAYYDTVTGLANRSLFLERLAQRMQVATSSGNKVAVGLIDLERFRNINDSLGQSAGDSLLRQVSEWLTENMGSANLLARVGADHFAMLLPEIGEASDVTRLLDNKREAFSGHSFFLDGNAFRIGFKAGVSIFPDDSTNADILFKNAEAALKKAKLTGNPYLLYTPDMTEATAGRLSLENRLRQALDREEFVLHYQPKINLLSGNLTGAEALIRWNDPNTGLVSPGDFISILEETGLIREVGRWALRQAIKDYLHWRDQGLAVVRIAVNVSPLQLRHRDFVHEIGQAVGIDAHAAVGLELEITESLIMEDVKHGIASLQAIRAMGVTIAIDDFGTGFSSLSYLAKLPVDTLKIDRSFVTDMSASPEGLALVSTIITLAHSLKLKVVAEGVETEAQSRLLLANGCDEMQGYLFSKPVPGHEFGAKFLAATAMAA